MTFIQRISRFCRFKNYLRKMSIRLNAAVHGTGERLTAIERKVH